MQETESSLKRMQLRMQEAEKRMIQDDIINDDMLMVGSGEFAIPRGGSLYPRPNIHCALASIHYTDHPHLHVD